MRYWLRLERAASELSEEIEFHRELKQQELERAGMERREAAMAARRLMGNTTIAHEEARATWIWAQLDSVRQDIAYGFRKLRAQPAFTAAAILTVAAGIGTTTAVFSVVDRILFRPLPYAHEEELVSVGMMTPADSNEFLLADGYFALRRVAGPFAAVTSFQAGAIPCELTGSRQVQLDSLRIEANFPGTLGVPLFLGRSFLPEEDRRDGPRAVILSYDLWQSLFGGDPGVLGRRVGIDGVSTPVVGVLPKSFVMPTLAKADLFLPLALNEATEHAGRALRAFARLREGTSLAEARASLQPVADRMLETVPKEFRKEIHIELRPLRNRQLGTYTNVSVILFGAVLAMLLIACSNVANLLLAKGMARSQEFAMRAALGASRLRLARQALVESLLLGGLGGAAGCAVAWALLRMLVAMAPAGLPWIDRASLDTRTLLFTLAVAVGSGLLFGIAPALRVPAVADLGAWRSVGTGRSRLRFALVTIQVSISLVLLTGAGLLIRSLWNLEGVALGMQPGQVVTAHFVLGRYHYEKDAQQLVFFRALEERLRGIPGIQAAAITDSLPPTGGTRSRPLSAIEVEGRPRLREGTGGLVAWRFVTPGYFAALGIPLRRGRTFGEIDRAPDAYAMVLSESLAARLFPGENPIGKRLLRGPQGEWFTVIGVVGDVKNRGPADAPDPEYYVVRKAVAGVTYANQAPGVGWRGAWVVASTVINPNLAESALRSVIASLDPSLDVKVETMPQRLGEINQDQRFNALVLSVFAAAGLLLAGTGLYGVLSFLVAGRTREIGVRMALGATSGQILRRTLVEAARWTAAGFAVGLIVSLAAARVLQSLLYDVQPRDPKSLAAAVATLAVVALAASAGPAWRAARLDPADTLRHQ